MACPGKDRGNVAPARAADLTERSFWASCWEREREGRPPSILEGSFSTGLNPFQALLPLAHRNDFHQGGRVRQGSPLSAAFELVRRLQSKLQSQKEDTKCRFQEVRGRCPSLSPPDEGLRKEVFKVLLLNRANRLVKEVLISEGTLDASIVHPRDVFREAFSNPQPAVILIHNTSQWKPESE